MKNPLSRRHISQVMTAVVLLAILHAGASGSSEIKPNTAYTLLQKPALPLLGIVRSFEETPYPSDEEISVISKMYKGIHVPGGPQRTKDSPLWHKLRKKNPDFMVLPYFQSTLTSKVEVDVGMAEADPLHLISMYLEGAIDTAISPEAETFKIIPENSKSGFGIKASTIPGDFSKSTSEYIIMIRIGDEIMKVVSVDKQSHAITVMRGYKNTKAGTHAAGANVFAPVYRGKPGGKSDDYGSTSNYPGYSDSGAKSIPQYHLRLDSKETGDLLALSAEEVIQKGATGLWLDLTSPAVFCPCNAYGDKVTPWNFEKNEPYTKSTYLNHQELKCKNLRDAVKNATSITPQLVANNHANGKYFEENGAGMNLVRPTERKPVPINGVILEAAFCFYQSKHWFGMDQWSANLSTLIHGSQNKYPVWPWIKNIKYANFPMIKNEEAERYQLFDYASTLLGYENDAGVVCPMPLYWVDDQGTRALNLPEYLFYDIGDPVERVGYDEIDKMAIPETHTYMRKWSKAIVLVNPTDFDDANISVPDAYLDPATNKEVRQVAMAAHTGKILLKIDL